MKNNIFRIVSGTLAILTIPLLAKWPWTLSDFIIMGVLLFGTGLLLSFAFSKVKNFNQRIIIGCIILLAFFLIWAELAVGIFGTPFAGS